MKKATKRRNDIVDILRANRIISMERVSEILDCCTRTIFKDAKVLRKQGYPVITKSGRSGGISLKETRE